MNSRALDEVIAAAADLLRHVDEPMAKSFTTLLSDAIGGDVATEPTPFPLGAYPELQSRSNEATASAVAAIESAAGQINWWQSSAELVPPGWVEHSGATELVGPEGSIRGDDSARFGIFYLSPGLDYPDHWHDADEFYLVLAGGAEWTVAGETGWKGPGAYVRTPSRAVHRIVTRDEPMLAFWGWAGDTSFDSYAY